MTETDQAKFQSFFYMKTGTLAINNQQHPQIPTHVGETLHFTSKCANSMCFWLGLHSLCVTLDLWYHTRHVVMAVSFDNILFCRAFSIQIWKIKPFIQACLSALGSPIKLSTMVGLSLTPVRLWLSLLFWLEYKLLWPTSCTFIEGCYANAAKCWFKLINSLRLCIVLPDSLLLLLWVRLWYTCPRNASASLFWAV